MGKQSSPASIIDDEWRKRFGEARGVHFQAYRKRRGTGRRAATEGAAEASGSRREELSGSAGNKAMTGKLLWGQALAMVDSGCAAMLWNGVAASSVEATARAARQALNSASKALVLAISG